MPDDVIMHQQQQLLITATTFMTENISDDKLYCMQQSMRHILCIDRFVP